ncbi:MAG TPA: hypothetical protein GX691_06505 [Clostridia bacterium]|jgi:hypothetical protein|nr:hypothetical protein [Clostridia bacterium]
MFERKLGGKKFIPIVDVYYELREKCARIPELENQSVTYVVFSKSGFTEKMLETAGAGEKLMLVDEDRLLGD